MASDNKFDCIRGKYYKIVYKMMGKSLKTSRINGENDIGK
jgi:hypothetical protein